MNPVVWQFAYIQAFQWWFQTRGIAPTDALRNSYAVTANEYATNMANLSTLSLSRAPTHEKI